MNRRNFLAAVGAAAAGTTAVGTGAFTSVNANRTVSVSVADDSEALLGLRAPDSLENGEYATDATEGDTDTLVLNFDAEATVAGTGVNEDAVSRFDYVFEVVNRGTQFVRLGVDRTGLAAPDAWTFYPYGNARSAYPGWDDGYVGPGIGPGSAMAVGISLDTTDDAALEGGQITILARG